MGNPARSSPRPAPVAIVAGAGLLLCSTIGSAAAIRVAPGEDIQQALARSQAGDTVRVPAGLYTGPVTIRRSVRLLGEPGATIDGGGHGRVITVAAPDVTVTGLTVRNSGDSLADEDSGIFVTPAGDHALITANRLQHNLIGIYLKGPDRAVVRDNTITGRRDLRMNERGNGIHLWNTPGSIVEGNNIRYGRDGIFVTTSRDNTFRDNRFADLRFAIHYMYTNDSQVIGNYSRGNHIGFALMFSHRLQVQDNVSEGDRDRGILLNYANHSNVLGNLVKARPEKCLFIYNANANRISANYFEGCEIGIHFTAGSENNRIYGNAFVNSRNQVKYVGTRLVEWSIEGQGNYWSDNVAYDLNGDGIADEPYRPNDLVDQLLWRYPSAKLLLNSPALHVLRWAQSQFPLLHPGGVIDRAPLMHPPVQAAAVEG